MALAWKRSTPPVSRRSELLRDASGWTLRGTILLLHQGAPFEARYEVACG